MALALSLAPFLSAACGATEIEEAWRQSTALEAGEKLGGCALGDLDVARPGDEIAAVAGSGAVWMVARDGDKWTGEKIADLPGEMIQCAIGDVLSEHPGDELVVVGTKEGSEDDGGPGAAWLAWRTADGWQTQLITEDEALLHAVCIGDFDSSTPEQDVLLAGYSGNVRLFSRADGSWQEFARLSDAGPAKGAAAGLRGAVIVDAAGAVSEVWPDEGGWQRRELAKFDGALARVSATADEVLFSANDGKLRLWSEGRTETIYHSSDRLRGALFVDIDPLVEGTELATAGYDGSITLLHDRGTVWNPLPVASDDDRFHHLATGVIEGLGRVLVGCGYSGRITVVSSNKR